jgi:hypothetical protein
VTSLTWLLPDPWISYSWKSPLIVAPESRLHQISELRRFQNFADSWFQNFTNLNHPEIDSRFAHRCQIRLLFSHITWRPKKHLRLIRISSWMFPFHETELFTPKEIHEFRQIWHFEGVRVLPNSPTLAPRGSELTPTIRFHENSRIMERNVTLGTSEWTRVLWNTRNGHIEAVSWNYPPHPYK